MGAAFERQISAFVRHPLLASSPELTAQLRGSGAGSRGKASAWLAGVLEPLWKEQSDGSLPVIACPAGGFGDISDPVVLALLDVGLLVPRFSSNGGAMQLPNKLTAAW